MFHPSLLLLVCVCCTYAWRALPIARYRSPQIGFHSIDAARFIAIDRPSFALRAGIDSALDGDTTPVDTDDVSGLPDRAKFSAFFKKTVKAGKDMRLDQFMRYEVVAALLDDDLVLPEDIDDLWVSAVGDAAGLSENEAYEMLCMVLDVPEPVDEDFLDSEFSKLTGGADTLTYTKFLGWQDVQDILDEEALNLERISDIWRDVAGDLNSSIDNKQFHKLNSVLDAALAAIDGDDEDLDEGEDEEIDLTGVDIWSSSFNPKDVFDDESISEITDFYTKAAGMKGIALADLMKWGDIREMLAEGLVSEADIKSIWSEASRGSKFIDLDTFIRFNVKLDLLMEERGVGTDVELDEEDAEGFYRSEFAQITGGGRLMRLDMLLGWSEVAELIKDGVLTERKVRKMFEGLPKEPMGIPSDVFGITEDTFVAFNSMLDVLMDASGSGGEGKAATPSPLIAEKARPMPSEKELKIGSLGGAPSSSSDEASTGLTASEMELMETLDKADNMLNSGSFSAFDQLIGDMNDPRLQALREKDPDSLAVKGNLNELLDELMIMAGQQKRCGLDKPAEEDAARMRATIQAVIEQAPKASSKNINDLRLTVNGKWKLLYTNSEMFDFYNGVTGFVNVFPASKFESLSAEYSSDGFLSEAKYYETLTSPLGPISATVFSTWELLKEMSFMTNDNSVVLRSYCSKVTAGPMEYEAQENWKSLRTMSMNELVYVDDRTMITRNCGALRIFFVYQRE